jgi:hypothetical protein
MAGINFDFTAGTLPGGIAFTRSTTGTYNSSGGILTVAAINAPRFNFVGGTACLLIEPAATNLLLQSNNFSNASWFLFNGAAATAAQFVSPDGTNNGWSISSGTGFAGPQQFLTFSNVLQTVSVWVKRITGAAPLSIQLNNVNTGDLVTSTTLTRFARAMTPSAGAANASFFVDDVSGKVNGFYGAQLEIGPVATSYIPTTTAAGARAADSATFTIPAGVSQLTFKFDDNSTQIVAATPGSYTIPTNLNRANIKTIVGPQAAGRVAAPSDLEGLGGVGQMRVNRL